VSRRALTPRRRRRRALVATVPALGALALGISLGLPGPGGTPRAAAQSAGEATVAQADGSITADHVTMFGASPGEATDETWGLGLYNEQSVLVRYTPATGWARGPELLDAGGHALHDFKLDQPEGARYPNPSPLAGQMTPDGSGVLAGSVPSGEAGGAQQVVLVREPGGSFKEASPLPPESEGGLKKGERLYGLNSAPMIAALEETGGSSRTGALIVPVNEGGTVDSSVLHWNGSTWTREPIEIPAQSSEQFEVLAIGASSPGNAWMIAKLSSEYPAGSVALFRRHLGKPGETPTWRAVTPKSGGEPGDPLTVRTANEKHEEQKEFTVPSNDQSQVLTVTGEGIWINGARHDVGASTTLFFKPEGEAAGHVVTAWCVLPPNAPASAYGCRYALPEPLPTGPSRSFAWANAATPEGLGERIITGLPEGVSLRLQGTTFTEVPALGASPHPLDVGGSYGAAFSSPQEGWLGQELLPVHLTARANEVKSRLSPWPVPFRDALLALAPEPGAPVGSLSSEALAVGDQGEVARYVPGEGWLPESLLGPGGRRERPRLRAVAWPTPQRAYAVGDLGTMWLWRGETGLWEADPATPVNFRGNLLGVAFDPGNPARGYAVGQGGVLLRYGKSWTQEGEEAIPPAARGASFTSIAFAGSQALVAYRKLVNGRYQGGLIVNEGSGWQIDQSAAAAMGSNIPWPVAGLPDGGAAFTASGVGQGSRVYERESAGSGWQSTPYPGTGEPASLALFREGGALRAIGAGTAPFTLLIDSEPASPPGFPPTLIGPYPLAADPEKGVFRQTATGWSDEEHELNNAKEGPGQYTRYDTVYRPDPVSAVLVGADGSQGWAVGGFVDSEAPVLDTSDVERYPADGSTPPGVERAPVPASSAPGVTTFAVGGNAQCGAPCADRAGARIGPDMWLSNARRIASEIPAVQAFLYTGPRVTTGATVVGAELVIPYARELGRYAEVLGSGIAQPFLPAPSPTDLDGAQTEASFHEAFPNLPAPPGACSQKTPGCQAAYYPESFGPSGANVRVLVLDDTGEVGGAQLEWLEAELKAAKNGSEPAIAVGDKPASAALAKVLIDGGASAYFFDSPEQNVQLPLRADGRSIPSFGSGTLGYVDYAAEEKGDFIGAGGFLLAQVEVAKRNSATNVAPVTAKLIPNVGELAMEAQDGTLLRRSQAALFDALARRPRSGSVAHHQSSAPETSPYIPIPTNCVGTECAKEVPMEFTFSSSKTGIGDFVTPNLAVSNRAVLLGSDGKPIHDSQSGLFCAYNAGETTVKISAGGWSASLPVTVQSGSVRQPCGTVLAESQPSARQAAPVPPPPAPTPTPAGAAPASAPPVVPVPPAPVPAPPAARPTPKLPATPFFLAPTIPVLLPAIVPPPLPAPANPTPPSGTSAVTSPVEAAQNEEEEESAPESASAQAVAYRQVEHEPSPVYILGIVLLAAFAGASLRGRPGRRGRPVELAHATLTTSRAQRRYSRPRGRP
jgi:hypothetical protein